jgi:hypothetical protein
MTPIWWQCSKCGACLATFSTRCPQPMCESTGCDGRRMALVDQCSFPESESW